MADCAVDAFSKAFSRSTSPRRPEAAHGKTKATSPELPAEVLSVIFSFLYASVYKHYWFDEDCPEQDEWLEQDLMSPSLFPYAPASVCSFWRDAMSSVPKCWGRVVIFVDLPATSLSVISSQLSWSRDGQLDVFITRRAFYDIDGRHERSQVADIMNLIFPHIHRIRDLSINVMFSSSLPSILTDFHGNATMMLDLELRCREDSGGPNRNEFVTSSTDRKEFRCPRIKYFAIDGRNCYEACRSNPQWTDKIATVVDLTISHFHPRPGESFSTHELLFPLHTLSNLNVLRITDVALHPSTEQVEIPDIDISLGEFANLHCFEVMHQIIRFLNDPFAISFIRCTFEGITDESNHFANNGGGELKLAKIDYDLAPLLRLWHGNSLSVAACSRFDDTLLHAMSSNENGVFRCAMYVESLTIHNCPNFSVAALRRFVESRSDNQVTPRIRNIQFYGDVPSMSPVEQVWFDAHLPDPDTPDLVFL